MPGAAHSDGPPHSGGAAARPSDTRRQRSRMVGWIDARLYPGYGDRWDDELFRRTLMRFLRADSRVLEIGAGKGRIPQMNFKTEAARVCGVDPDERVLDNPYLHEAKVARAEEIPYPDESFDLVLANNVLEHLEDPPAVFSEVARVLVPGGRFLAKTPNRTHYVSWIARCTPHGFHRWYNRRRGRLETDTFPTFYRANSRAQIARGAAAAGLELLSLTHHEGRPEYLRLSGPSYLLGLAYERLVNGWSALAGFRVLIVAVLGKPARDGG